MDRINTLPDDVLLLIFETLDLKLFDERSLDLFPLFAVALVCKRWHDLAFTLLYQNLRFRSASHAGSFIQHHLALLRANLPAPNLASTMRLCLHMQDTLEPSWCDKDCIVAFFRLLSRLKVFVALEALPTRELQMLNELCGHSLEEMDLVLAAQSLDRPSLGSLNNLSQLRRLGLTFLGNQNDIRIDTSGLCLTLPHVRQLKLIFADWHYSAVALFKTLHLPQLRSLSVQDSTSTLLHPLLHSFLQLHAQLEELELNNLTQMDEVWNMELLPLFQSLRKLTLRQVPKAEVCDRLPQSLEELRIPMWHWQTPAVNFLRLTEEDDRARARYRDEWAFLDRLLACSPRTLRLVRGRNIYVSSQSWILDWKRLSEGKVEMAVGERFARFARAMRGRGVEVRDWRGKGVPEGLVRRLGLE